MPKKMFGSLFERLHQLRLPQKQEAGIPPTCVAGDEHTGKLRDAHPAAKQPWRRIVAALCLMAGISVAACITMWVHFNSADPHSLARIGQPLPPLMVDASGVAVDLNRSIAGMRCIVVFYSPSCRICREVLPALQPFPAAIRLIMVSESAARDDSETLGFPGAELFYDRWGVLSRSFAAAALPTIIFVDENGILRDGLAGSHGRELVQQKLKEFADRHHDPAFEKPW